MSSLLLRLFAASCLRSHHDLEGSLCWGRHMSGADIDGTGCEEMSSSLCNCQSMAIASFLIKIL
eukprot:scaffold60107_cov18-Prasinocladus_malaysianus.AAC.3